MESNSVCNHTHDKEIGLPLRGRPILLSFIWLQTELDSTQSYITITYMYVSDQNPDVLRFKLSRSTVLSRGTIFMLLSCSVWGCEWKPSGNKWTKALEQYFYVVLFIMLCKDLRWF